MLGSRRQLALAGALAMLVGVLLQGADAAAELQAWTTVGPGHPGHLPMIGNLPPSGTTPVAVRVRPWDTGSLFSLARSSRNRIDGLRLALLAGLVVTATSAWALTRPDRPVATPLRRPEVGASRAPPAHRTT